MSSFTQIWSGRDDFEAAAAEAIALTKPECEPAVVVDLFTRQTFDTRSGA